MNIQINVDLIIIMYCAMVDKTTNLNDIPCYSTRIPWVIVCIF